MLLVDPGEDGGQHNDGKTDKSRYSQVIGKTDNEPAAGYGLHDDGNTIFFGKGLGLLFTGLFENVEHLLRNLDAEVENLKGFHGPAGYKSQYKHRSGYRH